MGDTTHPCMSGIMISMATKKTPIRPARVMNPRVTLRAQTIPNKKRQANKEACRKQRSYHE